MKAVRLHSFGGSEVLTIEDVDRPEPGSDEVLIRVRAASINPVDYKMRSGAYRRAELHPPLTLGRDVAGVVERIGPAVRHVRAGDEVYAMLGAHSGGYAEYAVARAGEVAPKPATLDYPHAAAVPLAALTAWQGLFDHGRLQRGERVLIHGAAGGVGHFAVQFARHRGAHVIATARAEDAALLRELGADEVIDYRSEDFTTRVRDIDLVLDLVAGETQQRSWSVLKDGGRIISTLQPPSADEAASHHAHAANYLAKPNHEQLAEIARLIDHGRVTVVLDRTLPLADARAAHDHLEHDHVRGKVVLTVGAND
jgi:NADPH:quinone reductase-like Zn-dependent oxidoreductase